VPEHVVQQRGRARIEPRAQVGDRGQPDAVDVVERAGWARLAGASSGLPSTSRSSRTGSGPTIGSLKRGA
jgi:hypothetical protein